MRTVGSHLYTGGRNWRDCTFEFCSCDSQGQWWLTFGEVFLFYVQAYGWSSLERGSTLKGWRCCSGQQQQGMPDMHALQILQRVPSCQQIPAECKELLIPCSHNSSAEVGWGQQSCSSPGACKYKIYHQIFCSGWRRVQHGPCPLHSQGLLCTMSKGTLPGKSFSVQEASAKRFVHGD